LAAVYEKLRVPYGTPVIAEKGTKLPPLSDKFVPAEDIMELKALLDRPLPAMVP